MVTGARLSVIELRRSSRHPVSHTLLAAHRDRGSIEVHIANISTHGFMAERSGPFERGERMVIRLPLIGRIEAHCIWIADERAGFQFERVIREDDFAQLVEDLQSAPPPRRRK